MDWLAATAFIAGIILLILGGSLVLNLPAVLTFMQEILGFLCLALGALSLFVGVKLIRSI